MLDSVPGLTELTGPPWLTELTAVDVGRAIGPGCAELTAVAVGRIELTGPWPGCAELTAVAVGRSAELVTRPPATPSSSADDRTRIVSVLSVRFFMAGFLWVRVVDESAYVQRECHAASKPAVD